MFATYDVTGYHGRQGDEEPRSLTGRMLALSYERDGLSQIITVFMPESPDTLIGCPVTFGRPQPEGRVAMERELHTAYACTLVFDALFPRRLSATEERLSEERAERVILGMPVALALRVQTIPDREGGGWMRTDGLARFSDEVVLPPGRGQVRAWTAKYVVDGEGLLSLVDQFYSAVIAEQGNIVLEVRCNIARTSVRSLSEGETERLREDVSMLRAASRDWRDDWKIERGEALKKIRQLMRQEGESAFASALPAIESQLTWEIGRFGEYQREKPQWRPPGAIHGKPEKETNTPPTE
jgi:hypothetical protein